jgi:hypothetical protein
VIGLLAHAGIPGWAPLAAFGLFFAGMAAAIFGYWFWHARHDSVGRVVGVGFGALAVGCLVVGTAVPLIVHATPNPTRPSTRATLSFISPTDGQLFQGDPASVPVTLTLVGGKIVPISSLHLVPDEGHIHLYLDGHLISMTGTDSLISVPPGTHTLEAEFVAIDHGPFNPRVTVTVSFRVSG